MATETVQTIESDDLTLGDIFKDFYVVPSFQREYVWKEEQVEQLLQDIHDEFSEDSVNGEPPEYFIGSIVVCPGSEGVLDLIDGQQRMTTAFLFLCAFREYLKSHSDQMETLGLQIASKSINKLGEEIPRFRVQLQYEDSRGVLEKMADHEKDLTKINRSTLSVTNILNAYQVISTFLRTEFTEDVLGSRRFYAYFINQVKLVRIKTHSVAHALKVFETINDRGVGLDPMDLLKNLMFMKANKDQYDALKNKWKGLVDSLYRANEKPLRFLRYFIFASYNVDRLREDQIYTWFSKNEKLCGYDKKPLEFVDSLVEAVTAYTHFVQGKNYDGTPNRYLANIRSLSGAARQHLILLLAGRNLLKEDFVELCRQLENLFFAYIITREPTKEFERRFANWAPSLRNIENRVELDNFIEDKITPAKHNLATRFELAFQELRESSIQKYRMRYVLGKLTQYVNEKAYGETEDDLSRFLNQRDVEHILPQTPTEPIISIFDKPNEIYDYIQRLGNMTLLEESINRSIHNQPYSAKITKYPDSHFLLTRTIAKKVMIGETKIDRAVKGLKTWEVWDSISIEERQEVLTTLAHKVWEMPNSTGSEKATGD